ncbi:hypothetical protein CPB84DRAFT_1224611 [Gymnopilus junonius]|uniref:Uncharacterized protein n=1 Tax=Gymnopilus junonius TaxID=109634 RepID=A0A9P5NZY0_GYMJU|nr:hypothetical protein CPB84DRAFT_1224611 [Gymnopilus junonius]
MEIIPESSPDLRCRLSVMFLENYAGRPAFESDKPDIRRHIVKYLYICDTSDITLLVPYLQIIQRAVCIFGDELIRPRSPRWQGVFRGIVCCSEIQKDAAICKKGNKRPKYRIWRSIPRDQQCKFKGLLITLGLSRGIMAPPRRTYLVLNGIRKCLRGVKVIVTGRNHSKHGGTFFRGVCIQGFWL